MSEDLKQRFPLLEYLQRHHWTGRPVGTGSEFVGLCPLHRFAIAAAPLRDAPSFR
jgi:hypothetical protein